jgi:serine/threonine protein kinase
MCLLKTTTPAPIPWGTPWKLAFELCTGKRPFDGSTPFSLFLAHVSSGIPEPKSLNPTLPNWLSTMIEICVEKEKKHRYQSIKEIVSLFHANLSGNEQSIISKLLSAFSARRAG